MKRIPKVSVIIPVYNSEKYLKRCLESVLNQTLKEIEIIVINDGSKDSSLSIIKNYLKKDERIILIDKCNEGVSRARNEGIKISKGIYCLNVDSDDWIEENYCQSLYDKAERENLDIVISDFFDDWDNGKMKYNIQLSVDENDPIKSEQYLQKIFDGETNVYMWNKLIRRELYKKYCIKYPEKIKIGEDFVVLVQLIYFSKNIGKINAAFYHYIINPDSVMRNIGIKELENWLEAFNEIDLFFNDKGLNKEKLINRKLINLSILFNIKLNGTKDEKKLINYYIEIIQKSNINKNNFTLKLRIYFYFLRKIKSKDIFYKINYLNRKLSKVKSILKL